MLPQHPELLLTRSLRPDLHYLAGLPSVLMSTARTAGGARRTCRATPSNCRPVRLRSSLWGVKSLHDL